MENLKSPRIPLAYSAASVFKQGRMKGWIMEQETFNHHRENQAQRAESQYELAPIYSTSFLPSLIGDMDSEDGTKAKKRSTRNPLSHRMIEKRRRDRMNSCLADLSRLIPSPYTKKGRGRIEKTEIVEMAIKHVQNLEANKRRIDDCIERAKEESKRVYRLGYMECMSETIRYISHIEGQSVRDGINRRLIDHLQENLKKISSQDGCTSTQSFDSISNSTLGLGEPRPNESNLVTQPKVELDGNIEESSLNKSNKSPDEMNFGDDETPEKPVEIIQHHSTYSDTSENSRYKFKKRIKERFQADSGLSKSDLGSSYSNGVSLSPASVGKKSSKSSSQKSGSGSDTSSESVISSQTNSCISFTGGSSGDSGNQLTLGLRKPIMETVSNPSDWNGHSGGSTPVSSNSVTRPGFVLHASKSFYVPTRINLPSEGYFESCDQPFVLHPVNISVNFAIHSTTALDTADLSTDPSQPIPAMSL